MSIENELCRIATALEKLTGNVQQVAAAPVVTTETTKVEPAITYTDDDVRKAVRQFMLLPDVGQKGAEALIVKYGAKADKPRVTEVKDKNGLMNEIKKAIGE